MEEQRREVIRELDNEWHTLKHGNPVPGLYPQTGTELVKVRGSSRIEARIMPTCVSGERTLIW